MDTKENKKLQVVIMGILIFIFNLIMERLFDIDKLIFISMGILYFTMDTNINQYYLQNNGKRE